MKSSSGRRGVAIITALFVVMLVTTLVTLTLSEARRSLEITRFAAARTEAYFRARSAVERGLKSLNEQPLWESTHEGPGAAQETFDGTCRTWVETVNSERLYLLAEARVGEVRVQSCQVILRKRPVDALTLALWKPDGPDTVLFKKASEADWNHAGPPPRMFWDKDGSGNWTVPQTITYGDGKPKYVNDLEMVTGDSQGNLYAVWTRDGEADMVFKFDGDTQEWTLLPGVPRMVFSAGQFQPNGELVGSLDHLASNGDKLLYALNEQDGVDAISVLDVDDTNTGWKTLPPMPKRIWNKSQNRWDEYPDSFAKSTKRVSADADGNVYARFSVEDKPDTIYRFVPQADDPSQGEWQCLPPIPDGYWDLQADGNHQFQLDGGFVGKSKQLTVSPEGQVVVRQSRSGVDTHYVFVAEGGPTEGSFERPGHWEPIRPAPRVYFDSSGARHEEDGVSGDFKNSAVDQAGGLLTQWARGGLDTLFRYDFPEKEWKDLPPIPKVRYDVDANHDLVPQQYPGEFIGAVEGLGGGGIADLTRWEYQRGGSY